MNELSLSSENTIAAHRDLQCFVKLGLLNFWRSALPDDKKLIPLLLLELQQCLGDDALPEWSSYKERFLTDFIEAHQNLPLVRLIRHYQLSISDVFLLALLGEVENNYLINLIIAELQSPEKSSRPAIHLLENLLAYCFEENHPEQAFFLQLNHHPLIKAGLILRDTTDTPLPLQKLKTTAMIWQLLIGAKEPWAGCSFIDSHHFSNPHLVSKEIDQLTAMLNPYYLNRSSKKLLTLNGIIIRGAPGTGRHQFAAALAQRLSLNALSVPVGCWQKTPLLHRLSAFCHWLPVLNPSLGPGEVFKLEPTINPVVILLGAEGSVDCEDLLEVRLQLPDAEERCQSWLNVTGDLPLAKTLSDNALLSEKAIYTVANLAKRLADKENVPISLQHIQQARRHQSAEKLRLLAEPVFRNVDINAMVLPPMVAEGLEHLVLRANKRERLWQGLGKTLKATPNPGVRALLVGDSGTGKTLAASFVATQLSAPLYRVDLSSIMNKYIGESEKNLANLLDEAAASDVVLLFDEADSLFGSRSDGDNNGERFANMLTNFLLTRIENHPGVVILTTNSKERIDNAFNRRLDVIIDFPLPGFEERLALWRSHLGERGPGEKIYRDLATYSDFTGGQIRNAVLVASVYADGHTITQHNIWQGLMAEYHKLGRDMPGQLGYLGRCSMGSLDAAS